MNVASMTRGQKVIAFIEKYCLTPEGTHVGRPIVLAPFQKEFLLDVYDNPHSTRVAILSMARKNGKTGLIACMVLAHLVGSEAVKNSRLVSGALSREQAGEVFNYASKMVMLSETLGKIIRIVPSSKRLIGLPFNTEYQAISAEAKTAQGKSPIVAIIDEIGQVRGDNSPFIDAITTAQGAHESPLLIYISTQAANDADLFSILIDDALKNKPPNTVCHVYAADADAAMDGVEVWRAANPALGLFRSESDMREQAEKAMRMPSFEPTFRNLNLNQRVSSVGGFINKSSWQACQIPKEDMPALQDCDVVYGGLDLSMRTDLTALVLVGLQSGKRYVYSYFWSPADTLEARAKQDRAPYVLWEQQGYIRAISGVTLDYDAIAREVVEICEGLNIDSLYYDRWRIELFRRALEPYSNYIPLKECGQGFKDMSPAVEAAEEAIYNKVLRHDGNPVLTMCMHNAKVVRDPAGNRKLDKSIRTGRIDGAVALVMALGAASLQDNSETVVDEWINNPLMGAIKTRG